MKRYVIAAITCIALTVGVSPAAAGGGLGSVVETLTGTAQQNANTAGDASAFNANGTSQSNDQSQTGSGGDATTGDASTGGAGCCGSGDATSGDATGGDVTQSQEASNTNSTTQEASAESKAVQVLPVNVAVPICVAKACDTGSVEQSNTNTSGDASAKNVNVTDQSNEQSQTGTGGNARSGDATAASGDATTGDAAGGDVTQSQKASNENVTSQKATAVSKAIQVAPVNVAVPVCVAWSCKTPDVEQRNTNTSGDASASNVNATWQGNDQSQTGTGGDATTGDATTGGAGCCGSSGDATSGHAYGGDVVQSQEASNGNSTSQDASATSKAVQVLPVNVAVPVCVAKPCKTGSIEQSNTNTSGDAWAGNANETAQSNRQSQAGAGGNATSGDAESRGCCKPGWHEPKPEPKRCGHPEPKPKPKPCKPEHAGDARTGDATGGDVTQSQSATNDNGTAQTARAASIAKQEQALNLFLAPTCPKPAPKPAPRGCKPC